METSAAEAAAPEPATLIKSNLHDLQGISRKLTLQRELVLVHM